MVFFDRAEIFVSGGRGGDGCVGFRREKYVPAGGPAGGDGGRGGDVYLEVDSELATLADFRYRHQYKAGDGQPGEGGNRSGKAGQDLVVNVPPGTVVREKGGATLCDLVHAGQRALVAFGGRGGRGNARFSTPTRQAPGFAEKGSQPTAAHLELELKLIADVGFVGMPNAGKSTLLAAITQAKPKIASYPFTTLTPNLGVVHVDQGHSFVVADIPGLIEGAHAGAGLGIDFLKHIERTRLLVHVVDVAAVDGLEPVRGFRLINEELAKFSATLARRPQIVVANKMDLPDASTYLPKLEQFVRKQGMQFMLISAATRRGIDAFVRQLSQTVLRLRREETPAPVSEEDRLVIAAPKPEKAASPEDFSVHKEDQVYVVKGAGLEAVIQRLDVDNEEVLRYLQRLFDQVGLYARLRELGVEEGALVRIGELEFEYQD